MGLIISSVLLHLYLFSLYWEFHSVSITELCVPCSFHFYIEADSHLIAQADLELTQYTYYMSLELEILLSLLPK